MVFHIDAFIRHILHTPFRKIFVPAKLPCLHFHPSLLPLYDVIIVRELVYNTEMVEMGIIIETAFIFV